MNVNALKRKAVLLAIILPLAAMAAVVATTNGSLAQQAGIGNQAGNYGGMGGRSPGGDSSASSPFTAGIPPCKPGAAVTANCRGWTPPRRTAASEDDCSCGISYVMQNGVRVATRDCYVLLPTQQVHYCHADTAVRR